MKSSKGGVRPRTVSGPNASTTFLAAFRLGLLSWIGAVDDVVATAFASDLPPVEREMAFASDLPPLEREVASEVALTHRVSYQTKMMEIDLLVQLTSRILA